MNDNNFQKSFEQFSETMQKYMPQFRTNANGYEIRTQVLDMAKQFTEFEYSAKWAGFEGSVKRSEDGEILNQVTLPDVPGVDAVLETAEKFYNFVNKK